MTPRGRAVLTAVAGAALLAVLLAGFAHLPPFGVYLGPYGTVLNGVAAAERKIPNVVTAVNFDYRGLDTMGEEYILFAAVAGLTLVLRHDRAETSDEPLAGPPGRERQGRSDAVRAFSLLGIALTIAYGWYVAMHPHLTPGGGFQGGAITAGFAALLFLGVGYRPFQRLADESLSEPIEAVGGGGYVAVGLAALATGAAFLTNILPLGRDGAFFSTGTILVINFFVAIEVTAGFILMFSEFARETRVEQ